MREAVKPFKIETASEFLTRILEDFSHDEPIDVAICWTTGNNRLLQNNNVDDPCKAIGMLEVAKKVIIDELGDNIDEEDDES